MSNNLRIFFIVFFLLLGIGSSFYVFNLQASFDFEQFFPQGDPDLEFFQDFIENFEGDDNFLLVGVSREAGVFDSTFLEKFHDLSIKTKGLPHALESQSLTKVSYPIRTPFGITAIPAIHRATPSKYESDKAKILQDERFVYNLISPDAKTLVIFLKTEPGMQLDAARAQMDALDSLVATYNFEQHHYLGRPYFQKELVDMQKREIMVSAGVSGILVLLVMFFIFRRIGGVLLALVSVGLAMLIFFGFLGFSGRELNAMGALYPVLMIIVGTSDVIHLMSKYIDELSKGNAKKEAILTTVKEIGIATLLTSITTAVGFLSLSTSRVIPIRDFGVNSAIGVMIAYVTVICFTTAVMSFMSKEQLIKDGKSHAFWKKSMNWSYWFTKNNSRKIAWGALVVLVITGIGISKITTNYTIINNLPRGEKITADFHFYEENFTGFRPLEFAVLAQNDHQIDEYAVIKEIDKVETHIRENYPSIRAISSITTVYKTIHQAFNAGKMEEYKMPKDEREFKKFQKFAERLPKSNISILVSKDGTKGRITSRILDMGADTIKEASEEIDAWIAANTDSNIVQFKQTGTGLIIDKNASYVRYSLLTGLGMAIVIVSLLMALLFRSWKMLIVSLVPNFFPLLLAGALLGFVGIELEAGVSIVFAVIFGIAVDDTIHFLSKFKLARSRGLSIDDALHTTFVETGKAIVLTSIILFFGFLILLFSVHPPSVTVGLLISLTLFSALIADLTLIPILIRWLFKDEE